MMRWIPLAFIALATAPVPGAVAQEVPALEGQVALVTGSTSGLGRVLAYQLGALGAEVIVHGRDAERGREVVDSIRRTGGKARFYRADLGSRDEVRELAAAIRRDYPRLDLFISNAGVGPAPDERLLSLDGLELRFHVNYLAGYQLTQLLLPLLERSAPAKIVMVASRTQQRIDFGDIMLTRGFSGHAAYARSKLAQIMFTFDVAPELEGTGVTINAVHPAPVMDTKMMDIAGARPQTTPEDGARSVMNVVLSDEGWNGRYFHELEPGTADPQAYDEGARARLRRVSEELAGVGGGGEEWRRPMEAAAGMSGGRRVPVDDVALRAPGAPSPAASRPEDEVRRHRKAEADERSRDETHFRVPPMESWTTRGRPLRADSTRSNGIRRAVAPPGSCP